MKLYCTRVLTNKTNLRYNVLHTLVTTHQIKLDCVIK
jgi:hypothetical protein